MSTCVCIHYAGDNERCEVHVRSEPLDESELAAYVLDRLIAVESDRRPDLQAGGWDAETGEEVWE